MFGLILKARFMKYFFCFLYYKDRKKSVTRVCLLTGFNLFSKIFLREECLSGFIIDKYNLNKICDAVSTVLMMDLKGKKERTSRCGNQWKLEERMKHQLQEGIIHSCKQMDKGMIYTLVKILKDERLTRNEEKSC